MNKNKYLIFCSLTFDKDTHGPAKFIKIVNKNLHIGNLSKIILTPDKKKETSNVLQIKQNLPKIIGIFWELIYSFRFYRKIKELDSNLEIQGIIFTDVKLSFFSLLLIRKIPIIGMLNDYENIEFFDSFDNLNIKTFILKFKSWIVEVVSILICKKIIVNSFFLEKSLKTKFIGRFLKIHVLYKAIDIGNISKENPNLPFNKNQIKILFAKNDFVRGGLTELIKALNFLDQYNFLLTIVGPIESEYQRFINNQKIEQHLNLEFLGGISNGEVLKLMTEKDMFCVPARREALGVANLEAMCLGIPIVSTSSGGILETTNNGEFAWLAIPCNFESLAFQLQNCISDKNRLEKIDNAKKFVKTKFSHDEMIKNFTNILMEEFSIR